MNMKKKFWFFRDTIGPIGAKFSPAEVVGIVAIGFLLASIIDMLL